MFCISYNSKQCLEHCTSFHIENASALDRLFVCHVGITSSAVTLNVQIRGLEYSRGEGQWGYGYNRTKSNFNKTAYRFL